MGELTGKQRDREMNRSDIGIRNDDTLLVAAEYDSIPQRGFVERYNMKFDKC